MYECRPFCALPGRNQVFFYECVVRDKKITRQRTWIYDIETNSFRNLKPHTQPTDAEAPGTVLYLPRFDSVFMAAGKNRQWIYSFKENSWSRLPLKSDSRLGFATPYCQMAYSQKYNVLINTGWATRGTSVMRTELR